VVQLLHLLAVLKEAVLLVLGRKEGVQLDNETKPVAMVSLAGLHNCSSS
jgi:hypothetical protein